MALLLFALALALRLLLPWPAEQLRTVFSGSDALEQVFAVFSSDG